MGKYFGTDGFRGEANKQLTADHAYKIGRFLGWYYGQRCKKSASIAIGKDTRRSSYMFEYAIAAGLTASGADAYLLHVTTTPSVSFVVRQENFDCGVMISASHNPYFDNGIKLINGFGEKMDEETILKIENYIDGNISEFGIEGDDIPMALGQFIGRSIDYVAGRNRYVGYLISLASHSYKDIKVGLDCANGSAWMIAKSVFDALGAKTYVINAEPNGLNINKDAGSTHIEVLKKFVKENALDIGFAYDGDADRCIAVDENGNEVNGDSILYILGMGLKKEGSLKNNTVVTTVMSNIGLYRAFDKAGISYVATDVGDKYVYENMTKTGNCLGGEQSGHIILSKYATTGDGILTSIMIMETMLEEKLPLSKLCSAVVIYPQVMVNVKVLDKIAVMNDPDVLAKSEKINAELGKEGRILIRKSGTEPVVRVMVEAKDKDICNKYINQVIELLKSKHYMI